MFSKKIIVIKQMAEGYSAGAKPVCGICRLEKENDVLTALLSFIGFSALISGTYRVYIVGDDKTVIGKDVGKIPTSFALHSESALSLEHGVSVGVWAIKDDIPLLVAYQKSDDAKMSLKEYGAIVINEIIAERKAREREKEFVLEKKPPNTPATPPALDEKFALYNDEAVATENYYDTDEKIIQKLENIKEIAYEHIRTENHVRDNFRPQTEKEGEEDAYLSQNETGAGRSEVVPYYLSVKSELDGIFRKFPAETALERAFDGSRFAKVYYADDKYYVVGVIKENDKEKYICYGVPSAYRETPPKELAGYCSFVPLSIFDLKGNGYFMMFQDAVSGKCVHKGQDCDY